MENTKKKKRKLREKTLERTFEEKKIDSCLISYYIK